MYFDIAWLAIAMSYPSVRRNLFLVHKYHQLTMDKGQFVVDYVCSGGALPPAIPASHTVTKETNT
ncbi:unnamed protein product [Penicillium salamii]|nr:unnamed protein product [Penicillium salamii]